jgi:exported beta-lactamase
MKLLFTFLLFPLLAVAQPKISCKEVIKPYEDFQSPLAFEETVVALQKTLNSKGITVFATIEHHKAAEAVGESMSPATVLIVGNPKVGTALMQENPLLAIELPLKILIYEEGKTVNIRYEKVAAIAEKYHIKQNFSTAERIDAAMQQLIKSTIGK